MRWSRIDLDEVKFELFGDGVADEQIDQVGWDAIYQEMYQRIEASLRRGETVVHDTGNFTKAEREVVRAIGEKQGIDVLTVFVNVPKETARQRLLENRRDKTRFDVPDWVFEATTDEMEAPDSNEPHISYTEHDSLDKWIERYLVKPTRATAKGRSLSKEAVSFPY